jgi:predicted dehydrogenase
MKPVRVGVVGVGYLGEHHARIYSEMPGVELVAVVDPIEERVRAIAERLGCRACLNHQEILGKVDAVSIAAPTSLHHTLCLDFLQRDIDVLLEKPMTVSLEEADRLIEEADRHQRILQIGHLERFNGAIRKLKGIVQGPRFIESHRLGPFVNRGTDVDVILDLMIHDIDILLSVVQSKVREIRAVGTPVISSSVDIANARIEFENGCVANVTASRVSREKIRKIRVFQPDAYISLDYQLQELMVYRRVVDSEKGPQILMERVETEKDEPLRVELESFIHSVRCREQPSISGRDGREALKVALEILALIHRSS